MEDYVRTFYKAVITEEKFIQNSMFWKRRWRRSLALFHVLYLHRWPGHSYK